MQDWPNHSQRPGRPGFGRRSAQGAQADSIPPPVQPAQAQPPPAQAQPAPKQATPPLAQSPLKAAAAAYLDEVPLAGPPSAQNDLPPVAETIAAAAAIASRKHTPTPHKRRKAVTIVAIVVGTVLGVAGGTLAVELGRLSAAPRGPALSDDDAAPRPWTRYKGWPTGDYSKFSNAAALRSPPKPTRPRKLEGPLAGDPVKGGELTLAGRGAANCLACHVIGDRGTNQPGNVGPDLSTIGTVGRTDEYLYNYVYDPRVYNPDTIMPPWGAHGVLSDADIRDIVAYLKTLKTPATFKNPLDDPARRPVPKDDRDNLDPMVNPGMWAIDRARELWIAKGPAGNACITCHHTPDPEVRFKTWAATMPRWDGKLEKVLGVEEFVYRHAKATTGHSWKMESEDNIAVATYLRNLANGATIAVDVRGAGAKAALARGKEIMERKIGRLNFSCTDCHSTAKAANRWARGQWLGDARGATVHFPTWRTSRNQVWDIRRRFQWCNVAIGADELPPDAKEYGDLELYLTSLSNGLKLSVPGIRP